jgi:hypothetical protein
MSVVARFGPSKLSESGRMIGRALRERRRAGQGSPFHQRGDLPVGAQARLLGHSTTRARA